MLDYPEFHLPSPEGLSLLMNTYKLACRDPFPLEALHLPWSNTRGQLSWLKQAIVGCPEFSIAKYPMRVLQFSEDLKINMNSEEVKTW